MLRRWASWPQGHPPTLVSVFKHRDSVCAPGRTPSPTPSPFSEPQAQGASLHLVSFITARLDVLQSLQNWSLAEN